MVMNKVPENLTVSTIYEFMNVHLNEKIKTKLIEWWPLKQVGRTSSDVGSNWWVVAARRSIGHMKDHTNRLRSASTAPSS